MEYTLVALGDSEKGQWQISHVEDVMKKDALFVCAILNFRMLGIGIIPESCGTEGDNMEKELKEIKKIIAELESDIFGYDHEQLYRYKNAIPEIERIVESALPLLVCDNKEGILSVSQTENTVLVVFCCKEHAKDYFTEHRFVVPSSDD